MCPTRLRCERETAWSHSVTPPLRYNLVGHTQLPKVGGQLMTDEADEEDDGKEYEFN